MIYYIYKITFLCGSPEGRYYIGKRTFRGFNIEYDNYTGSGNFCFKYFKKYGAIKGETYTKEILEITNSKASNNDREKFYISDLYKTDPLCMNQSPGGFGGNTYNIKTKNKSKKNLIKFLKTKKPAIGHKCPEWLKKLNSDKLSKCVVQYSKEGKFIKKYKSITAACKELNLYRANIISSCNRKNAILAGECFWRYEGDTVTKQDLEKINNQFTKVLQFTLSGEYITTFKSIKDAVKAVNGNHSAICSCCKGRRSTAYGYKWKYVNDLCQS